MEVRGRCEQLLAADPDWLGEQRNKVLRITLNSIKPNGKPVDHWAERMRDRGSPPKKRKKKVEAEADAEGEDTSK